MNKNCPVHSRFLQHASSASHFEGSFCQCSASSQVSRFFLASCISLDDSFRLNSDSLFSSWPALRTLSTPSNSLTYLHHPPLSTGRIPAHHPLLPPWIAPGNAPFVRNRSIVDRSKKGTDLRTSRISCTARCRIAHGGETVPTYSRGIGSKRIIAVTTNSTATLRSRAKSRHMIHG